jgi:hypothetical protein
MAKGPGNLVLKMLREIRTRLDRDEDRFDKVDRKLDDMSESLTCSLGFSMQPTSGMRASRSGSMPLNSASSG